MTRQELIRMIAGECMVSENDADKALFLCNDSVGDAIGRLTVERGGWAREH